MSRSPGISGPNTPKYKVVQGYFYTLVLHFEQDLSTLAAKFFQKKLIPLGSCEEASNSNQPSFERSSALLRRILKKIEINQSFYDVFVSVLREISELADIAFEVETALKLEEDSSNGSPRVFPSPFYRKQRVKEHARRHSDSDVIQSRLDHTSEVDSGAQQLSTFAGGEVFPEEEDDRAFDSESEHGDHNDLVPVAEASVSARAELQVSPLPKRATSALVFSQADSASNGSISAVNVMNIHGRNYVEYVGMEGADCLHPVQRASSDGLGLLTSDVDTVFNSNAWNRGAENTYLKSQTEVQDSEISNLRQTIETLKEEKATSAEKLKQQGMVVSQKDDIIDGLKKDCKEKDERVADLKKDKAEMEKRIDNLEDKCSEAETKQERSGEEIKRVHSSYKAQLDTLQKKIEEVESREKIALIDLANAKAKLSDALLEKEREISKLREEFFKQEKIKYELQLTKRNLEEEKRVELALKEKELALKDKELALKDKELMMKDKEVAEAKEKRAEDTASYAKKETKRAKKETEHANEERRKSDLRVLELEKELEKLRLDSIKLTN